MSNIGVITEQNDLGLGFDPLSKEDQATYNSSLGNTTQPVSSYSNSQTSTQLEQNNKNN